jgi:hypothetical protein
MYGSGWLAMAIAVAASKPVTAINPIETFLKPLRVRFLDPKPRAVASLPRLTCLPLLT